MDTGLIDIARDLVGRGGFVMWPLLGATAVLWWALGSRAITLYLGDVAGRAERAAKDVANAVPGGYLRHHLDTRLGMFEDEMQRYDTLVTAIIVAAPLTGLLGTVIGMMETFDALGDMALFSQSGGIAGGISQALLTTQTGLTIAIPGLLVGRLLKRRQASIEEHLELLKNRVCLDNLTATPAGSAA